MTWSSSWSDSSPASVSDTTGGAIDVYELMQDVAEFWSRVMLANTIWLITVFELDEG